MSLDPTAEYERVREKCAPMRPYDAALYVLAVALLAIVSLFRQVDGFFFASVIMAAAAWELTKIRLRRKARHFADSGR